ncbi:Uncharacterised protein [Segatella copri]|nr:Uncharacterised protein [Segatella copri]
MVPSSDLTLTSNKLVRKSLDSIKSGYNSGKMASSLEEELPMSKPKEEASSPKEPVLKLDNSGASLAVLL